MSDPPGNPVLDYLRRIEAKLDSLAQNMTDVQERLDIMEGQVMSIQGILGCRPDPTP